MAQRTEKEETEYNKVVREKTLTLCVKSCGVIGNPATNNMCQNCFNASSSKVAYPHKFANILTRSTSSDLKKYVDRAVKDDDKAKESVSPAKSEVNRCSGCRRKLGLTGFRCRCGELFCGEHRYSDRHDCSYDYRTAGREAIARQNPLVKASKIVKL
ncbi:zinc finger A20 and AN1 domain-containing stress-associated protein 5-like [Nicotiana tomentosiformis]|uniref:zinc finger A20 and AN1 domain-containing stress-associated protein 5-like n=1 Tax=Nicotiana tomentosiformis TaxID=4098 RepID=UPI00051B1BF0|nr:zinc finger A20 and AN1 domain-containing stress-associated protein 5-like [Nicotiana tomentosiformis]